MFSSICIECSLLPLENLVSCHQSLVNFSQFDSISSDFSQFWSSSVSFEQVTQDKKRANRFQVLVSLPGILCHEFALLLCNLELQGPQKRTDVKLLHFSNTENGVITLMLLSLLFGKKQGKPSKCQDLSLRRTLKVLGREARTNEEGEIANRTRRQQREREREREREKTAERQRESGSEKCSGEIGDI